METFGRICYKILLAILQYLVVGFTLSILWGWFVTDTFGVQQITKTEATGLFALIHYVFEIKKINLKTKPESVTNSTKLFVLFAGASAFMLLIGWIITLFR